MTNKNSKNETTMIKANQGAAPVLGADPFALLPGLTPFSMMRRFTDDMERFFGDFNGFGLIPRLDAAFDIPKMKKFQKTMWAPQIEVTENDGQFVVRADLPGLKKDDVDIELSEGAIVISGERTQESKKEDDGYFRSERNYGSFYRSIPLPQGFDPEKAHASFANGVLEVTVPVPKKESKVHKVAISDKAEKTRAKSA